jgi:hypothetical protein
LRGSRPVQCRCGPLAHTALALPLPKAVVARMAMTTAGTTAMSGCGCLPTRCRRRLPTRCRRRLPTGCWQLPGRGLSGRARESGYRIADGKPSADRRPVLCRA